MQEVFDIGNFRFILDRLHCKQHLSSAGEALEPMTAVPTQQWAHEALEKLEAGQVATVVSEMPHRLAHNPRFRSLHPFSLLRRFTHVSAGHPIASRPPASLA